MINLLSSAQLNLRFKDETSPKMFSLQRDRQSFIVKRLCDQYFPNGARIIDTTSGTLNYWLYTDTDKYAYDADTHTLRLIREGKYKLVACDAEPAINLIIERMEKRLKKSKRTTLRLLPVCSMECRDLTRDSYGDLGEFDCAHFDPPYQIGEVSFEPADLMDATGGVSEAFRGSQSWGTHGLRKFVTNRNVKDFVERVRGLNERIAPILKKNGQLWVKVMNIHNDGKLIDHAYTCKKELTNFSLKEEYVYERMGMTSQGGTILHGYWLIFKKRS